MASRLAARHPFAPMLVPSLPVQDLRAWLSGLAGPPAGVTVVALDASDEASGPLPEMAVGFPVVVAGWIDGEAMPGVAPACDVLVATDEELNAIVSTLRANPLAALALVSLLRASEQRTVGDGLLMESAVYSSLQAGPEFARWLSTRSPKNRALEPAPPVWLERMGDRLDVTLDRPHVRNALNTSMRDALVEAFALPRLDPTITEVHLIGAGEDFCAGGDLDEFGSLPDPALAHLVRIRQSAGRSIDAVADRVVAHLHGACIGSGIELPAFARRVLAQPNTRIALPETSLGLIPGAGGTVSLPRRIGRHRTAWLCLTGKTIDAATALAWGLVDEITDAPTRTSFDSSQ